jgi:hypothetical protein
VLYGLGVFDRPQGPERFAGAPREAAAKTAHLHLRALIILDPTALDGGANPHKKKPRLEARLPHDWGPTRRRRLLSPERPVTKKA